jgi:hypothetical protein
MPKAENRKIAVLQNVVRNANVLFANKFSCKQKSQILLNYIAFPN